jgi:hypothetical protein
VDQLNRGDVSVPSIERKSKKADVGRMHTLQSDPPLGGAPMREFFVKAERIGRPPSPWIWAIYEMNRPDALHRSSRSYRSAEDAWAVGCEMLARLGRAG